MGHRHAGSQESYQSNADGESRKEDHCQRGIEASMDLRKFAFSAIDVDSRIYVIHLYNLKGKLLI